VPLDSARVLRLRVAIDNERADSVSAALDRTGGVRRLTKVPAEGAADGVVLAGDVTPAAADAVMSAIDGFGLAPVDYLLAREDVIAPSPVEHRMSSPAQDFAWVEVMGEARANARPIARYVALMSVAAAAAALGVVTENVILIVGAMAISPDVLPICATCVGLVGRRFGLAGRAFVTLAVGLGLVAAISAIGALLLDATGTLPHDFEIGAGGLGTLATTDYSTVLVALAAGVAAMLSFETRAGVAVGVAISVTTIPASAYLGVAFAVDEIGRGAGALLVLAVNVTLLLVSGSLTLAVQERLFARSRATAR
jgi:uncharacterized hydrophobic protein (TIGR00271 family)